MNLLPYVRSWVLATSLLCLVGLLGCEKPVSNIPSRAGKTPPAGTSAEQGGSVPGADPRSATSFPTAGSNVAGASNQSVASPSPTPNATLLNRSFTTITEVESDDPQQLVVHLQDIDQSMKDLFLAGSNNAIEKEVYEQSLRNLGDLKLKASQRLMDASEANSELQKSGALARLEALSHLSGMLQDVESAKQLEKFAEELSNSADPELSHQGRIVSLGFEIQALQNGVSKDPAKLLSQAESLFSVPSQKNFPGFMMLQNAHLVLQQMGFAEASEKIQQVIANEYQDSTDPLLRGEAWAFEVRDSQALQNFNNAIRTVGSPQFEPQILLAAARGLYGEFPTDATLEQMASLIGKIEYGGQVDFSMQLADYVASNLSQATGSPAAKLASQLIANHKARVNLVGLEPDFSSLVTLDNQPIDWEAYKGKVVLVDFWATWCIPCLEEIPNLLDAHQELSDSGLAILSVNMDESLEKAKQFVESKTYPWITYRFADKPGFASEFASANGIEMIPFVLIINKEGIVSRIHVRGDEIQTAIRTELGLTNSIIPDEFDIPETSTP